MSVDDARCDDLSAEIQHRGAGRNRRFRGWSHVADAAVLHGDGEVFLRARAGAVDHGGASQDNDLRRRAHRKQERRRHNKNDQDPRLSHIDSFFFLPLTFRPDRTDASRILATPRTLLDFNFTRQEEIHIVYPVVSIGS
jgi:hypothetical protein